MKALKGSCFIFVLLLSTIFLSYSPAEADEFRIAIMQEERGAAAKYRPLETYLKTKGIDLVLIGATNYPAAAKMFAEGRVDAMFSGSGIAGIFIIKELAVPLVRPVHKEGYSTYHAQIIAPAGSPRFTGNAEYFKGKKITFTSLASSGEIFFYSIPNIKVSKATVIKAASHGAAIEALSNGGADIAIVKNHVWDRLQVKYPKLISVGEDSGENPDGTLILAKQADNAVASKLSAILINLKNDSTPQAKAALNELGVREFTKTTSSDFKHTFELLKDAGIDKSFNFEFK